MGVTNQSFTASLFKKDAHVVPHQTTTATRNTLHMLTAIIKLCTGGTSLSPCSLPSYTCFVPIRTCAQGGYFTLPLLIAIVYVLRTNSYLCAGRVLHSPPAHCHSIRVSYQFVPVRREGTSLSPCCTFQPHNNKFKSNSNASKVGRPFHLR